MAIIFTALLPFVATAHSVEMENRLVHAAEEGQIAEIQRLIREGADLKHTAVLTAAVRVNNIVVVRFLIEHGVDANGGIQKGKPIYEAANLGNRAMLKYLVDHGADLNAENPTDTSVISTPLLNAVYYGKLNAARFLIESGANVNWVSQRGNTAFHQAIIFTSGQAIEFVKLLLEKGANPDLKNGHGVTPRQLAQAQPANGIGALIEQVKPSPVKPRAPAPIYRHTLDSLNADVVEQVMKLSSKSLREVQPSSGIFYYEGVGLPKFSECKYMKEFRQINPEIRVLTAICGNGPFDEINIDETMSNNKNILGMIFSQGNTNNRKDEILGKFTRDQQIAKTKRSISYMLPLIGHGVEFVPTSIFLDSVTHTSFIVQIAISEEEFNNVSRIQEIAIDLYARVTGSH